MCMYHRNNQKNNNYNNNNNNNDEPNNDTTNTNFNWSDLVYLCIYGGWIQSLLGHHLWGYRSYHSGRFTVATAEMRKAFEAIWDFSDGDEDLSQQTFFCQQKWGWCSFAEIYI